MYKWILVTCLLFIGCAHLTEWKFFTPLAQPKQGQSLLYVYHDCSKGKIIGEGLHVFLNGLKRAYMPQGSYFATFTNIGLNNIEARHIENTQSFQFNLEPKQTVYLKLFPSLNSSVTIKKVDIQIAEKEIVKCRLAKADYYTSVDAI